MMLSIIIAVFQPAGRGGFLCHQDPQRLPVEQVYSKMASPGERERGRGRERESMCHLLNVRFRSAESASCVKRSLKDDMA